MLINKNWLNLSRLKQRITMKKLQSTQEVIDIMKSGGAVLFTTPNCPTCENLKVNMDANGSTIPFFVLEDANMYPAKDLGITTAPVLICFKEDKPIVRVNGYVSSKYLNSIANAHQLNEPSLEQLNLALSGSLLAFAENNMDVDAEDVPTISIETIKQTIETSSKLYHETIGETDVNVAPEHEEAYDNYLDGMAKWIYGLATKK